MSSDEMHYGGRWGSLCCRPPADPAACMQLEEALYVAGCGGIWQQEKGAMAAPGEKFLVDALIAYFPDPDEAELRQLALRLQSDGLVAGEITFAPVDDQDWMAVWRQHFSLTELTAATMVLPSWQEIPEPQLSKPGSPASEKIYLKIYPGQGFGTGTHETTRLAAIMLEEQLTAFSQPAVLDVGTGSGILAILAAYRNADRVLALDVDQDALENARENVALNDFSQRIELSSRPLAAVDEQFDIVVANIIAPVLLEILPDLVRCLKNNGSLILSGMLAEQTGRVLERASVFALEPVAESALQEWRGLRLRTGAEKIAAN